MPTFISVQGEMRPAKETVGLTNHSDKTITVNGKEVGPGMPYVYEGPDRAALFMLWEQSGKPEDAKQCMTYLGSSFRTDPEFIARVRQMGFSNIDEYLKAIGYDEVADKKRCEEKAMTVKSHEVVKRAKEIEVYGGGIEQGTGKVLATGAIGDVAMPV